MIFNIYLTLSSKFNLKETQYVCNNKNRSSKKNQDRVNIYIDEKFFMAIYKELVFTFNLKKGDNIEEDNLRQILKDEMFLKGKNKALNILSKASQSEKKIREKLVDDFEEDVIDEVIEFLKKYNFINDNELACLKNCKY